MPPPDPQLKAYAPKGVPQTEPFKNKTLQWCAGKFMIRTADGAKDRMRPANGCYDFCVPFNDPTVAYIRREKEEAGRRKRAKHGAAASEPDRGHTSIMPHVVTDFGLDDEGEPMIVRETEDAAFAGSAEFVDGALVEWTNASGHYKVGAEIDTSPKITLKQGGGYTQAPNTEALANLAHLVATQTSKLRIGEERMLPMDRFRRWNGEK